MVRFALDLGGWARQGVEGARMSAYDKLLEPIKIGTHTWKNRIAKGPSSTLFWGPDQFCNDTVINTFEAIAKGGAAAVTIGAGISDDPAMLICKDGSSGFTVEDYPFPGLYDDKFIPGLSKLADAIHKHGSEIIMQIFQNGSALKTEGGSWGPSDVAEADLPSPVPYCFPVRGVSHEEIQSFKERYIDAAERCKKAGLDGVEVHAANGYFVMSFTSRIWNKRTDEYGPQSFENRTRLACELIGGIKERCGEDFIVGVRMNGQEFGHPDGTTMEESAEFAKLYEAAGADYISVTGYGYGDCPFQYAADYWQYPKADADMKQYLPRLEDKGLLVPLAQNVKHAGVKVPVFGIGSLTPDTAEAAIEAGEMDLALFARGLWADPDMANKLAAGHPEDVRRCNHCATCDAEAPGIHKRCRVNPAFGREAELGNYGPAATRKKVLVVGGGAAGLECARVAAERGHDVTLCEKESMLTLELKLATMVKGSVSEDVPALIEFLESQAAKQPNLTIKTKCEGTPAFVKKFKPDAIVVATGGKYGVPNVPGIDSKIVSTVPQLTKMAAAPLKIFGANALNKLSQVALPGIGKNCIVLGAQIEGIQGAIFLQKRGKNVVVFDEVDKVADRMPPRYADRSLHYLAEAGVSITTGVTFKEITKKGLSYIQDGQEKFQSADTIMVFQSPGADLSVYEQLKGMAPEVYSIGACNGEDTSLMVDALSQGREVAVRL